MLARSLLERPRRGSFVAQGKKVLIVGAGDAGNLILREMLSNRLAGYEPIGLIDDDRNKLRYRFQGVKVLGTTDDLPEILKARQPDEVHIALPSASGPKRASVVATCREARIPVKTLPNVNDLLNGDNDLVAQLRAVQVEDILGREPVQLDPAAVGAYVRGRTVLVTGAGGSIGSELCRQLVRMEVGRLILADHAENNLFQIDRELRDARVTEVVPAIADVQRRGAHGGDLRDSPAGGRVPRGRLQARAADGGASRAGAAQQRAGHAHRRPPRGAPRASTASCSSRPTRPCTRRRSMGASKALAEWVVEALGQVEHETTFVAVRFGNVLGSSGSVVPIFRDQIARGGPVTVTRPEMTRYFMTIPEAAQLIVQAGGVGHGGDVFVLDMGDPVRILDLAHDMIRLSGHEPERDIDDPFTGIRPGEKLHEELFEDVGEVERTHHDKLLRAPPLADRRRHGSTGELAALERWPTTATSRPPSTGARDDRQPAAAPTASSRPSPRRPEPMDTRQLAALSPSSSAGRSRRPPRRSASRSRPCPWRCAPSRSASACADRPHRPPRRADPEAGRAVIARAQRILALERDMIRVAQEEADVLRGRLAIGASTGPGARLLPRLLIGFRRLNSEVEVALPSTPRRTSTRRARARARARHRRRREAAPQPRLRAVPRRRDRARTARRPPGGRAASSRSTS